ncbi:hypothetical protein B0J13DRAFT_657313 [Dactylonectria estremocensis]|uniref:Uncharacterized protein n=1 Tax=Dactylonectria estremocensis TaxID=1079267 RepID=A0A9P9D654_9HYPO|nr:hypothetical protein B0J13DRAFT_657313 [Dactylonectria estremocensis]
MSCLCELAGLHRTRILLLKVGAACRHCEVRSTSLELLSRYLNKLYKDKIKKIGAKGHQWLRDHIEDNLTVQSWKANDIHHSWIVSAGSRQLGQEATGNTRFLQAAPDSIKDFAQQLFAEECEHLERQSGERPPDESGPAKELLTNWMRRTGWKDTFSRARRDILMTLSEMPWIYGQRFYLGAHDGKELYSSVGDECKLASIIAALDRLFDRCGETVRYTDVSVRRWLRGRFPDRPYKAPFELVMRPASERQYRSEFKRCACFWLRISRLPSPVARSITGQSLSGMHAGCWSNFGLIQFGTSKDHQTTPMQSIPTTKTWPVNLTKKANMKTPMMKQEVERKPWHILNTTVTNQMMNRR